MRESKEARNKALLMFQHLGILGRLLRSLHWLGHYKPRTVKFLAELVKNPSIRINNMALSPDHGF